MPADGHPQAAAHYLWAKQLERAFDAADPMGAGIAQLSLPWRLSDHSINWEGEVRTYDAGDRRLHNNQTLVIDDTFVNLWATPRTNP